MATLRQELAALLNRHSAENGSNTPDFVLAGFLSDCLAAFDTATKARDDFFGRTSVPGETAEPSEKEHT